MFNDLTKGGQTFFQSLRMFFAIFWKLVTVFVFIFVVSIMSLLYVKTTAYQRYQTFTLMKVYPISKLIDTVQNQFNKMGLMNTGFAGAKGQVAFKKPRWHGC